MQTLFNFLKSLSSPKNAAANASNVPADVDDYIERVVEGIDSKLRLVPDYKRKLRDVVALSLIHIDQLVNRIPGPINVSRKSFVSDPGVRAYFATPAVLQETFSHATEVNSYFAEQSHYFMHDCCALLCANMEEKTVMGTELKGNMLQHDIVQKTINLFDYKVIAPAPRDDEVRHGIKNCIFDGLITYALQHIACIKTKRRDLQNEHRILHTKLRTRQAQGNGLSTMLHEASRMVEESAAIKAQLAADEKKLNEMLDHKDVFSFYLNEVCKIFATPEQFIHLNADRFKLTDMRIKVSDNSPQSANTVSFSEIEIINVLKRIVAIIHYQRDDMAGFNEDQQLTV
jgi:hypothetical protein